jgi:hypothetical protein
MDLLHGDLLHVCRRPCLRETLRQLWPAMDPTWRIYRSCVWLNDDELVDGILPVYLDAGFRQSYWCERHLLCCYGECGDVVFSSSRDRLRDHGEWILSRRGDPAHHGRPSDTPSRVWVGDEDGRLYIPRPAYYCQPHYQVKT